MKQIGFRLRDAQGAGYYGASRGNRGHGGIDITYVEVEGSLVPLVPGHSVPSLVGGVVTKLGYAYPNDIYRYVEIKDDNGYLARHFYVKPAVVVGEAIKEGETIGILQNLHDRVGHNYEGMLNHMHFEVITYSGGEKVKHDPVKYLCGDL